MQGVEITAQDGHFSALLKFDETDGIHRGDGRVAAGKDGQARDIANASVREMREHRELLPACRLNQHPRARQHVQSREGRQTGRIVPESLGEPVAQHGCRQARWREPLAAFVRHSAERLLVDEAPFRVQAIGPAAENVSRELRVVGGGVITSQAESEAVLAARSAVASAGIAAAYVERADHLMAKTDRLRSIEVLDRDRHARRLSGRLDDEHGGSILLRLHETTGPYRRKRRRVHTELAEGGQITNGPVRVGARNDDLLARFRSYQRYGGRLDNQ